MGKGGGSTSDDYTQLRKIRKEHLQRVMHANRGRLLLQTPGPVHFGIAYALILISISPKLLSYFRTFEIPTSLGTSILLCPPFGLEGGCIPKIGQHFFVKKFRLKEVAPPCNTSPNSAHDLICYTRVYFSILYMMTWSIIINNPPPRKKRMSVDLIKIIMKFDATKASEYHWIQVYSPFTKFVT